MFEEHWVCDTVCHLFSPHAPPKGDEPAVKELCNLDMLFIEDSFNSLINVHPT